MKGDIRSRLESLRRSGELCSGSDVVKPTLPRQEFLFPGEEQVVETTAGPCYLRQMSFSLEESHGSGLLAEMLECRGADLALPARDGSLEEVSPERSLFLDIETTGLSGGTGTWVFLIGLGWLQDDKFYLRQYFLRHPSEEKAMLSHFTEKAAGFSSLVTFNGKSFDLPMIQTRQVLTGLPLRTDPNHHIDLLPCSRRLWKERLASCSLRSLEVELLGLRRYGDIPGEEIPAVYFNYLRRGDTMRMRDVFEHNVLDILSMVRLLARVARAVGDEPKHPADCFALGRLYCESGQVEKAVNCYKKAACCGDERLEQAALLRLSFVYKRQGMWAEAAALWHELIKRLSHDLTPYVELAKYYEHRAGDSVAALTLTEQALERLHHRFSASRSGELSDPALRHRQARLTRKSATEDGLSP